MSARFDFSPLPLEGLRLVTRKPIGDPRGFLARLWCAEEFAAHGWREPVAQINHTLTRRRATLRGLHFQHPPYAEDKLVSCLQGEIFDVAVDLRRDSPSFLQWYGVILSADNARSLLIPKGFAHGFQTLTDDCELLYLHSARYQADAEDGLDALDPRLAIAWPLPPGERSSRDEALPPLTANFAGVLP